MLKFLDTDDSSVIGVAYKDVENIYDHIYDEKSKNIFINRILYSMTYDYRYVRNIILNTKAGKELNQSLPERFVVYGAGVRGKDILALFGSERVEQFIDREKKGILNGIPICSPECYIHQKEKKIIISIEIGIDEVLDFFRESDIPSDNLIIYQKYMDVATANRYIDDECIPQKSLSENGLFFDVGCYDGIDSFRMIQKYGQNTNVIAIEPDEACYRYCKAALGDHANVKIIHAGVSNNEGVTGFISDGQGSHLSESGDNTIILRKIDSIASEEPVSFIKMDIEGEEKAALLGAKNVILRDKPVLAICVYHKRSDIFQIPKLILDIRDDYSFSFGHYTLSQGDTVLYAY